MHIRRAVADEADAIAGVWLASRKAAAPEILLPVHSDDEVGTWLREVVVVSREVWVGEEGGDLVAVLVLDGDWIDQLYVAPGRTGGGIGGEFITVAKRQRPAALRLWTFAANVRARHFYERHGFVATSMTAGDNEENAPDIRYEWSPSPLTD
ncbi:MAG TPA: GNAT family N-acetyltransferase [Acidimicrobiales bacterium]|nr:GNAT family N-acetyltransferase [Acidimicrobiales bacterium]